MPIRYLAACNSICQTLFALGEIIGALVGWIFINSWKTQFLLLVIPIPILFFVFYLFAPESFRWLHAKGRTDEAQSLLGKVALRNGCGINLPHIQLQPCDASENSASCLKILNVCSSLRSSLMFLTSIYLWFVVSLLYYSLTLDVGALHGNFYINSMFLSLVELPAIFSFYFIDKFGRKPTVMVFMFIASGAIIAAPFLSELEYDMYSKILSLLSKLGITSVFAILFVFQAELLPSIIRGTGIGCCSAAARIGSMICPLILTLDTIKFYFPDLLMGILGFISFILIAIFIPETNRKPLPEKFSQVFGKLSSEDSMTESLLISS